jgi:two-component system cell cycle sensor histidine kinase/response regulator CckA
MLEKRVRERTADLQASEERFRQLAENIQEVFWMFEPGTGRLLYVSPTYDAVWGRSREEVYKRPGVFTDTVHPDDRQQVRQGLAANWRTYDQEFRILRPDGTLRWIRLRSFPVRDSKGEVYRLAGIATDRTEQKAAEDALVQAERLSVAGKLAATMVHEINNPLQSVIGCLGLANEVLENKADPSKYLQIAYEEVKRAAGIVEQLRSLARPTQQVRKEPTDLNKLLNDLLVLNGKHLENHNIDVIWEPDVELPLLAVMRDAIRQLFLNLMLNAGDAMPEGGTLRLSTAHLKSPPGVRIAVSDTGVGIPPDVLPRIFEAFYSTKSDGLGIGLYVCQNVVQQHGGRIEVESEPGVGTTFTVWLPEDGSYGSELPSNEDMPSSE